MIFPFLKDVDDLRGVSIELGGSIFNASGGVSDLDLESTAIRLSADFGIGDGIDAEVYVNTGLIVADNAYEMTEDQLESLLQEIHLSDFAGKV